MKNNDCGSCYVNRIPMNTGKMHIRYSNYEINKMNWKCEQQIRIYILNEAWAYVALNKK